MKVIDEWVCEPHQVVFGTSFYYHVIQKWHEIRTFVNSKAKKKLYYGLNERQTCALFLIPGCYLDMLFIFELACNQSIVDHLKDE